MLSFPPAPTSSPEAITDKNLRLLIWRWECAWGAKEGLPTLQRRLTARGTNAPIVGAEPCARSHPHVCHHSNRSDKTAVCSVRVLERNGYHECFWDAPENTSHSQSPPIQAKITPTMDLFGENHTEQLTCALCLTQNDQVQGGNLNIHLKRTFERISIWLMFRNLSRLHNPGATGCTEAQAQLALSCLSAVFC